MIRFDKFTQKAQEAMQQSQEVATKSDGQVLYPLHLLIALAQEREGIVRPVLEKCCVQPDAIVSEGEHQLQNIPKVSMPPQNPSPARVEGMGSGVELPVGIQIPAPPERSNCFKCQDKVPSQNKSPTPNVRLS